MTPEDMPTSGAPVALVRQPNGTLALMVRDAAGVPQPFFVRGIESGFRQLPADTDFDTFFADSRRLGANTSAFAIH